MGLKDRRPGRWALKDRRWPAVRLAALRRDGWACVQCGSRLRLEVDHVESVAARPDRAFDQANLQTLCGPCHSRKTSEERGRGVRTADQEAWRKAVADLIVSS